MDVYNDTNENIIVGSTISTQIRHNTGIAEENQEVIIFEKIFKNWIKVPAITQKQILETTLKLKDIWRKIADNNAYKLLTSREKRKYGRDEFYKWIGKKTTINDDGRGKYIVGYKYQPERIDVQKKDFKYKKQTIPAPLRRIVWNNWIGEDIGKTKCMCCKLTDITQLTFNCGHIVAESRGGELKFENLKPICQSCNSSMGKQNMDEFILKYGF